MISIDTNSKSESSNHVTNSEQINEVRNYLDCRCITPHEAMWRLLQYDIHESYPGVERLPVHLEGENCVTFADSQKMGFIANAELFERTKLTEWFVLNQRDPHARTLTYAETPEKYVWDGQLKMWYPRQKHKRLGRIYYVHPSKGDLYYLRLLLNHARGSTSFQSLRTINNIVYETFQEACKAAGLIDNINEWVDALKDTSSWASSAELRKLFVYILLYSEPANPVHLWDSTWDLLGDDYQHNTEYNDSAHKLPENIIKDLILTDLQDSLTKAGQSLSTYGLPTPNFELANAYSNRLIQEQLSFNRPSLVMEGQKMHSMLNAEQLTICSDVINSVDKNDGRLFFVYGHGGTGKTFLWQTIITLVRAKNKIVLPVASSGLAALLLEGGTTAHSRFKIPIKVSETSTCDIRQGTQLAQLIQHTSLIIWDEAPMNHRHCFETLDRSLRDIMGVVCDVNRSKNFGGITVLCGGDFRQTLPIIPDGSRHDVISACITNSKLWPSCTIHTLQTNMRLLRPNMTSDEVRETKNFAQWLISIGEGRIRGKKLFGASEANWIELPSDLVIPFQTDPEQAIISATYPDFANNLDNIDYLRERAIVTPTNEDADSINDLIVDMVLGELHTYLSVDTIQSEGHISNELHDMYPPDYLNLITPNGMPNHILRLKIGMPVMLIRNIDQSAGLCNGTRLIISRLGRHTIEAEIITGHGSGNRTLIPRIIFISQDKKLPFALRRKQFPIRICYAMTINKSQGQTLTVIGIYLKRPVFSHGQLYVALSRARQRVGIKIVIVNPEDCHQQHTQNIVFQEIFSCLGTIVQY